MQNAVYFHNLFSLNSSTCSKTTSSTITSCVLQKIASSLQIIHDINTDLNSYVTSEYRRKHNNSLLCTDIWHISSSQTPLCHPNHNFTATIPKPLSTLLIIWKHLFHQYPKCFRMIHLYQVTQFMYDYIIHHFIGY